LANRTLSQRTKNIEDLWAKAGKCLDNKDYKEALRFFKECESLLPKNENPLNAIASIYYLTNDYSNAANYFTQSLVINPSQPTIHYNLGNCNKSLLKLNLAIKNYSYAIDLDPNFIDAFFNRALLQQELLNMESALSDIEKAIKLCGNKEYLAELYFSKGNMLLDVTKPKDALKLFDKAIQIKPAPQYRLSKGSALSEIGLAKNALVLFYKALINDYPDYSPALSNIGYVYLDNHNDQDAEEYFTKSLEMDPSNNTVRNNLGVLQLNRGNFKEGWKNFESRWLVDPRKSRFISTNKPLWSIGCSMENKVLIWGEEGIGDEIIYASMVSNENFNPKKTTICCTEKIKQLLKRSFPEFNVITFSEVKDDNFFDVHIRIGSLGQYLRSDIKEFKKQKERFLVTDVLRTKNFRQHIKSDKKYLCGLSWMSRAHKDKNCSLEELLPILKLDNVLFVNLQYGDTINEIENIKNKYNIDIVDVGIDLFNDIDGLASLIDSCDFIATTSNITPHIAGGLGKKTYLLTAISSRKFHYWFSNSQKSLWYPSVKIYQQASKGQWAKPIKLVLDEIKKDFNVH